MIKMGVKLRIFPHELGNLHSAALFTVIRYQNDLKLVKIFGAHYFLQKLSKIKI